MNIHGKNIVLRAIESGDLQCLQKWSNDPSIQSLLGGWHFPVSIQDQEKWYATLSINSTNQRFSIDVEGVGLIGVVSLTSIDWVNGCAFYGIMIGQKDLRGKGYALDALMALMRFVFNEMRLTRLDTDVIEYNIASLRFHLEKGGWKQEGVRKSWYYRDGRHWDKILLGITKQDYDELCFNTRYWEL